MHEPAVVGIDLGGTNVRLALVSPQGKILSRRERATATMPDRAALVAGLAADLAQAGEAARESGWEITAGGIGVPGRVLPREGRVVFSPNVAALNDCRLVDHLSLAVNWPLFLENDANLFALGEHWLGAGVGHDQMLGITLGTGVGGGLILNGRLWSGAEGTSGEIGHMTVDPEGQKCHCGSRGCLETMASAFWTVAWVKEQLAQGASSWLRELYEADPDAIEGQTLVVAALQSDPLVRRAFDRVGRSLGQAIAAVVHLLGLTRVVIGGRFARAWEVFQAPLQSELHRRLTLFPPEAVSVCPAQLGDDAGLVGAARLAWQALKPSESGPGPEEFGRFWCKGFLRRPRSRKVFHQVCLTHQLMTVHGGQAPPPAKALHDLRLGRRPTQDGPLSFPTPVRADPGFHRAGPPNPVRRHLKPAPPPFLAPATPTP